MNNETNTFDIAAPVSGEVRPLAELPDPAFSRGSLGPGSAVVPADGDITAPVSGSLMVAMPHAYGIRTAAGIEILVHIGIDTVNLAGAHFTQHVRRGAEIRAGEPLCTVDLAGVRAAGLDPTVIVVVTDTASTQTVRPTPNPRVRRGDALVSVLT